MAIQNTHRSYAGVAKEATHGTAVAPTAYIPVAVSKLKVQDIIDPLFDEGLRVLSSQELQLHSWP
jgi:hypothetical protein